MTDKEKTIKELKEALNSLDITNKYRLNLIRAIEYLQEEPVSEDLEEVAQEYTEKGSKCQEELDAFKAGAQWQKEKDESITKDLSEYINELSKQFPEVSFAKLSRIAVRVAKWQKEQMMANAIDARCFGFQGAALFSFRLPASNYLVGSEVKVIVINKD